MQNTGFDQLPLEWIRAFKAAARLGSFTAAAAETGLTQPAISQRIANLEARLGAQLFVRHARQIGLTPEGEAWLPHVQAALTGLRDSSESLFGVARNRLTISASASITELWLVPRLAMISEATGAQVRIKTMIVSKGQASDDDALRIRYGSGDWEGVYKHPLYDEVLAPVAAPQLPTSADWQDSPRIAVSGPRPDWQRWCEHTGASSTPVPHLQFDTFSSALAAARAGLGVLLASLPLVQSDLKQKRLQKVSEQVLPHHETYWLLASSERVSRRQWEQLSGCLAEV